MKIQLNLTARICGPACVWIVAMVAAAVAARGETTVSSPNGEISTSVSIVDGRLCYSVNARGMTVISQSPLGIISDGSNLGQGVEITSSSSSTDRSSFPSRHGIHATAGSHYNARKFVIHHRATNLSYELELRVFDDGLAIRYELRDAGSRVIAGEATEFELPSGTMVWHQPSISSNGGNYHEAEISSIPGGTSMGPPVVAKLPFNSGYLAITQSSPGAFANPSICKVRGDSGRALGVAYPGNAAGAIRLNSGGAAIFPWQVIIVARDLDALVNCDIVESLAPPPDPALFPDGASWATPGRSVWDWFSPLPLGSTQNNAMLNSYWASKLGFEYSTLDEGWESWSGEWTPLAEVTADANRLGVKILVCVESSAIDSEAERRELFARLKEASVSGLKVAFQDEDPLQSATAERLELTENILRDAATFELVVILHGGSKPVGQFRTYPNLLGSKAVASMQEHPSAAQSVSLPFTWFLAGPGDFTPVDLESTKNDRPGRRTPAYELATAINMSSPIITFAERADKMAKSPFAGILRNVPVMWDETRVLPPSEIGKTCVMARRSGRTWFVAAMNADVSRSWKMALNFLPPGEIYQAEIVRDGSTAVEHRLVTHESSLAAMTAAGGGFVARIHPPNPPVTAVPFATAFNPGAGDCFFAKGVLVRDQQWIDSAVLDSMPTWMWRIEGRGAEELHVGIDTRDAYFGGASLRVTGRLTGESLLRLFSTQLPVEEHTKIRLVSKRGVPHVSSGMKLALAFDGAPDVFQEFDVRSASTAGWNTVDIGLGNFAGQRITEIGLRFGSAETVERYAMQIGEIVVYTGEISPPEKPASLRVSRRVVLDADSIRLWLEWEPSPAPVRFYNIYARWLDGSREWLGASETPSAFIEMVRRRDKEAKVEIEVEAVGTNFGVSAPESVSVNLPPLPNLDHLLTGATIGTGGSWAGNGHTREKAFDNDTSTFVDSAESDGSWTGLDLGVNGQRTIRGIRFFPRRRWEERMLGGIFQGANNADFSDAVLLGTISAIPVEGVFSTMTVNSPERFRYVRYVSPRGGWANVAEIQFYGVDRASVLSSALVSGGTRVPMQAALSNGSQDPAELDQVIDGKDMSPAGWIVRPSETSTQSLIVKTAKPVQAQSFDLFLCFLSGRPGSYPSEFRLSYTTDSDPKLQGTWTLLKPERFTATGPDLQVIKDGRMATAGQTADAIFQVCMRAPVQPVTGFRIDVFPVSVDDQPSDWAAPWRKKRDVRLTEFRVNANHSTTTNVALGRPVKASHAVWNGTVETALTDGLPGTFAHPASPGAGNAFFFEIDLGVVRQIDHILLRGRADGYGADRMSQVKVEVFEEEPRGDALPMWSIIDRADGSHPEPGGVDILRASEGEGVCRGRFVRVSSESAVSFSPQLADVEVYATLAPQVTSLTADGEEIAVDHSLDVPAGTKSLTINFAVPGVNIPDQLPIRWRLEGLHSDWQTSRGLTVQMGNPPSGSFLLEAEIGHTDGEWDASRLVTTLHVARHFWQEPAFFVGVAVFGMGAAALVHRRVKRQRRARREALQRQKSELAEERRRIARNMHDEVGARLSQIAMMQDLVVRRHSLSEEARMALRELSLNTRCAVDALDQAVWAVNPKNDSLQGVVDYLSNTATNYLTPVEIACHLDVPLDWPVVEVRAQVRHQLVLAFQEALQNIVKHSGATMATLAISLENGLLCIRIDDNGCGFQHPPEQAGHDGVANMRERLASIGGEFAMRCLSSGGTEVEMRVPF